METNLYLKNNSLSRFLFWFGGFVASVAHIDRAQWVLLFPISLGAGVACFYSLGSAWVESSIIPVSILLVAGIFLPIVRRAWALVLLLPVVGFMVAYLHASSVLTPNFQGGGYRFTVEGYLRNVEPTATLPRDPSRAGKVRLIVTVDRLLDRNLRQIANSPERIRVTANVPAASVALADGSSGSRVMFNAILYAPSSAEIPGGYDARSTLFYERIGAVGRVVKGVKFVKPPEVRRGDGYTAGFGVFLETLKDRLAGGRFQLTRRIAERLERDQAAIGAALTTGMRGMIRPTLRRNLRQSGLAHILAISGLHIAVLASFLYGIIRFSLGAIPWACLHLSVHKVALVAALPFVFGYVALAGASWPTLRASFMFATFVCLVLLNRRPINQRTLALVFCVLVLFRPDAILSPGFQMSFLAVFALISIFERYGDELCLRFYGGMSLRLFGYGVSLLLASLVAGAATVLPVLQFFGIIPVYGVLANLVAAPLVSFVVLPLALLSLISLLMEDLTGWSEPANFIFTVWGSSMEVLLDIAHWFAELPLAAPTFARAPDGLYYLGLAGLIGLVWFRSGRFRLLSLSIFAGACLLMTQADPQSVYVAASGRSTAVTSETGDVWFQGGSDRSFAAGQILRSAGAARGAGDFRAASATGKLGMRCYKTGCVMDRHGTRITFPDRNRYVKNWCRDADVLVLPQFNVKSGDCPDQTLVIDRVYLKRWGGVSFAITEEGNIQLQRVLNPILLEGFGLDGQFEFDN